MNHLPVVPSACKKQNKTTLKMKLVDILLLTSGFLQNTLSMERIRHGIPGFGPHLCTILVSPDRQSVCSVTQNRKLIYATELWRSIRAISEQFSDE